MRGIAIAVSALVLASCQPAAPRASQQVQGSLNTAEEMRLWTDPDTGCRYFLYRYKVGNASTGGMSPRFRADGTPDCPGAR